MNAFAPAMKPEQNAEQICTTVEQKEKSDMVVIDTKTKLFHGKTTTICAHPAGIEPATPGLGILCSIH